MKNISILGSTGSIGTQTLDIVRANDDLKVVAMAAGSNIIKLEQQIREFYPKLVCVYDEAAAEKLVEIKDSLIILHPNIASKKRKFDGALVSTRLFLPDSSVVIIK